MFTMQLIEMFVCVGWEVQCGWVGGWEQGVKSDAGGGGVEKRNRNRNRAKKSRKRKVKEIGKRRGEQAESRR